MNPCAGHRGLGALAALAAMLAVASPAPASLPAPPEDELKAAVILSFLRYTEWHPGTAENAPITIGELGRAEFAATLRRVLEGKTVGTHPIRLLELKSAAEGRSCQVVYLAMGSPQELRSALAVLGESRVLTIGESDRFLDLGGEVNLFMTDGHMAFEFRKSALESTAYTISSKLLRFGQIRDRFKGVN